MPGLLFPKPVPRAVERDERRREEARRARSLSQRVGFRDAGRCCCCGKRAKPLHKHHLRYRSTGGHDETENLISLCGLCHAKVHAHLVDVTGANANRTIRFREQR